MAHKVTGASLKNIYDRLIEAPEYHPLDANTFSDWSIEAGDIVTVDRENDSYTSPVHSSKLVWRGAPQMTISSTGNKERDAVSKVSRKKYGRGGAAVRSQEYIYKEFHSEDGYLHSVLAMTESYLRTDFSDDMNSLRGEFEVTAASMRADFTDEINSLHGELVVTAESMRADFTDEINSLHGELVVTAASMRADFTDEINNLHGELVVTAESMRADFADEINSLHGELVVTAESMRADFADEINSLHGELVVTAASMRADFTDEVNSLHGELVTTAASLRADFTDEINSLHGELVVTSESMRADFADEINSLHGELVVTAGSLRADFTDEVNSLHGELVTTASSLRSEYTDEINSVSSRVAQQADRISLVIEGTGSNAYIKPAMIQAGIEHDTGSVIQLSADNIKLDGTTKLNDVMTVTSGAVGFNKPAIFMNDVSINSPYKLNLYEIDFQGSNTYVLDTSALGKMIKTISKDDSTGIVSIQLFDGTPISFRHAVSGGDYVTGSWGGGMLTVSATPTGEDSFIRTFKCGTVSWQNDKKAAYVNVTAVRTNGGSTYDEPDVFQVYVPTTESFNAGRNFYLYSEGWNNSGKLTIGAKDTNSGLVISGKTIDRTVTGGTPSWDGGTVTVPIRAYYGSTPPTYENTNANVVLNLSIADDGNNAVKLKNGSSDTGYTYTHNKYSSGYDSAHVKGTWSSNVFTYQKTNESGYANSNSVTISSAVAMQQGECYAYATWTSPSSTTPSSITGTSKKLTIVDSGNNAVKLQSGGSDVGLTYTHNKYTSGQNAVTLNNAAWQYDGDNVVANNRNTNTVSVTTAGRPAQLTKSATIYLDTSSAWSGNTKSIYVRRTNSSGEYVAVGSVTASLTTLNATSNGTYTPSGSNLGYSSVTVNVPKDYSNVRSRFNASSGNYYIEAYENGSSTTPISGSSVTYQLKIDDSSIRAASVRIYKSDGTSVMGSTPSVGLLNYWDTAQSNVGTSVAWSGGTMTVNKVTSISTTTSERHTYSLQIVNSSIRNTSVYVYENGSAVSGTPSQGLWTYWDTAQTNVGVSNVWDSNTLKTQKTTSVATTNVATNKFSANFVSESSKYYIYAGLMYSDTSGAPETFHKITNARMEYSMKIDSPTIRAASVKLYNSSGTQITTAPSQGLWDYWDRAYNAGAASVTPITNAKSRFNASSGSYYIEAYNNDSSATPVPGSSVTYQMKIDSPTIRAASVRIYKSDGTTIMGSTPSVGLWNYWDIAYNAGYDADHGLYINHSGFSEIPATVTLSFGEQYNIWPMFKKKDGNYQWSDSHRRTIIAPSNPYPTSKSLKCISKEYSSGTWKYTFQYSINNSSLWSTNTYYTFHHNSSFT